MNKNKNTADRPERGRSAIILYNMLWVIITVVIVALDRITKYYIETYLKDIVSLPLWRGVFNLTYYTNTGAALGILKNHRWVYMVFSSVAIIAIIIYFIVVKPKNKLCMVSLAFILGGGIGNMIDRIAYGYVVDFLDFSLIGFPYFNVADSFITMGAILLIFYVVFFECGIIKTHETCSK